jgi:hypothetical protein
MDVETIYQDKLKGKYKFMFDLKEKQKCLITNKTQLVFFQLDTMGKVYVSKWCLCFTMQFTVETYWFGNFTTEEPYD